ncbi:acid-soluble spore protein H [Chlamydia abortus]|uniref:H-type small acid-soluble spore protein n=1 Tax=Paenibacillus residui TaxID=629724 RepID=A0ABW3DAH4_9BACL|nr:MULTISPECIES: H-type small acid-soluble spore protein [Paenibacillaceae]SHE13498.1 acid-soluble spore protein H [Chlamydia abortus]
MDLLRAKEILDSENKINVEVNGQRVWIDSVDTESRTAKVHVEHKPEEMRFVPLEELHEV